MHTFGEVDEHRGPTTRLVALRRGVGDHWLLLLGAAALTALVVAVGPARLGGILAGAAWSLLGLMVPCVLALYVARGLAWHVLLRRLGLRLGALRAIRIMFAGQTLVFLPGGDLWRVGVMAEAEGLHRHGGAVAATVVFEDLVFMTLFSLALLPVLGRAPFLAPVAALSVVGLVLTCALLFWPAGYRAAAALALRVRPVRRFAGQIEELGPAFKHLATVRTLVRVAAFDAVGALLAFVLFELALRAVHVTWVGLDEAASVLAGAQMLAGFTMVPAGLGSYEALLTGLLAVVGVAPAAAAAAALLYRGFSDLLMAVLGLVASVGIRRA